MEKTFTVAGTSNLNGAVKYRFANDLAGRVKVLLKNGHVDVKLVELPYAMTKEDAIAYLQKDTVAEDTVQEAAVAQGVAVTQADIDELRAELEADGEDTATMTDDFLAIVAAREMESEGAPALAA
jgi:argininosuccinate synthase